MHGLFHPADILKKYWGYPAFRPMQEDIIRSVLQGMDVLALLPTGGGKSICYQVPALCFPDGICLVISPLIALMNDQVTQLQQRGIPALTIQAGMTWKEVNAVLQEALRGNCRFLYVSPERLQTRLFQEYLASLKINLIAVDEAHCISQWGYDFRPAYLKIAEIRTSLPGIPVLALTASAIAKVQDDIEAQLQFSENKRRFQQSFERPNLSYSVFQPDVKQVKLVEIIQNTTGSAIVYCRTRKQCRDVAALLKLHGLDADYYHAGLSREERISKQQNWISNQCRIMVSTNAFGMGIDKPDVRIVVHYGLPDCLENYYQEAGRAGRDGQKSYAALLYQPAELADLYQSAELRFPDAVRLRKLYTDLMNHLQVPAGYGESQTYPFELSFFCEHFSYQTQEAIYGVKALEQLGVLAFSEQFFRSSTVVFNCGRVSLEEFEEHHPKADELVKGLLRSYEGIFDTEVPVSEHRLATFIRWKPEDVTAGLKELHRLGMIVYQPQLDSPQITLLRNRMYQDSYQLDPGDMAERKKVYLERVQALDAYLHTPNCRSRYIAQYFNAPLQQDCGICDGCLSNRKSKTTAPATDVPALILHTLQQKPLSPRQLIQQLNTELPEQVIHTTIQWLLAEEKIYSDERGRLIVK